MSGYWSQSLYERGMGRSFVRSLQARVQSTLDASTEAFISVQCAIPWRGGELLGVCGVCVHCVGWRKEQ